jgi:hypothetical protein
MMSEGPEWFAPKRYGYGSGLPIAWQGWAVLVVYLALVGAVILLFERWPLAAVVMIIVLSSALMLISARTTRGGWRWRWGTRD